jgi:hypothetical protein
VDDESDGDEDGTGCRGSGNFMLFMAPLSRSEEVKQLWKVGCSLEPRDQLDFLCESSNQI